jgi:hypothetical protein
MSKTTAPKILITYTYFKSDSSNYNLLYFTLKALTYDENIDYHIVINGHECPINIPQLPNVHVIKRRNMGYDFGGHKASVEHAGHRKYDYYLFMNSGVIGPILPFHHPQTTHWSQVFIDKITSTVKLVGTTIVCLPEDDEGGYGPKIEGFFFATDKTGLDLIMADGTIFADHKFKHDAIISGEYALTKCIMKAGYTIDCMLHKYQKVNWLDPSNWRMNNNLHPSRHNSFYGKSINPYEVMFHKWFWHNDKNVVAFDMVDEYVKNTFKR